MIYITKEDLVHYIYNILHHPEYRERYGENLNRELPGIPLAPDFEAFASTGNELARLHVHYELWSPGHSNTSSGKRSLSPSVGPRRNAAQIYPLSRSTTR